MCGSLLPFDMCLCCSEGFIIAHGNDKWTFVFDAVSDWKRHRSYRFCFPLWMREQREGGTERNWQGEWKAGTSGVVVYLPREEVTKQFAFICWLYWFICPINALIPFLCLCTTVFLFPLRFVFVMTVGTRIKMLHIHKETCQTVFRDSVTQDWWRLMNPLEKRRGTDINTVSAAGWQWTVAVKVWCSHTLLGVPLSVMTPIH